MEQKQRQKQMNRGVFIALLVAIFSAVSTAKATTNEDDKLVADWMGKMKVQGMEAGMLFKIRKKDGNYSVKLDSLAENATNIPAELKSSEEGKIHIFIKVANANYKGEFSEDMNTITGHWEQMGMKIPLNLDRQEDMMEDEEEEAAEPLPAEMAAKLVGNWQGTLSVQGVELRLLFKITDPGNHILDGKFDSLDQPARDIPFAVNQAFDEIVFEVKMLNAKLQGTLSEDGKSIDGHWHQSGMKFPLKVEMQ